MIRSVPLCGPCHESAVAQLFSLNMKTRLHLHSLIPTLCVLLTLVGCSRKADNGHSDVNPHRDYLLHAQVDALCAKDVLTELRDGHSTNALEMLEMQIDSSVIIIDHSLTNLSGWERDSALGTLRVLKAYREAHPRKHEAVFQDVDKENAALLIQGAEEASRILSDLK